MAAAPRRRGRRPASRPRRPPSPSSDPGPRPGDAITVAWMVATFTSLVALVGFTVAWAAHQLGPNRTAASPLAGILLLAALASGLITLGLTPIVLRTRRLPPPRAVTALAVVAGLAPWLAAAVLWAIGGG